MAYFDLDTLLLRLQDNNRHSDFTRNVPAAALMALSGMAHTTFASQPAFLQLMPPVVVCGDIHGQFDDLHRIFNQLGYPPTTNYLFLGDYVDRGPRQIETIALLLGYKLKYPGNVFLLRGNHETASVNDVYGFRQELKSKYPGNVDELWRSFNEAFSQMPISAIIGNRILCMHGGLSPRLQERSQLVNLKRGWHNPENHTLENDLLWSDPDTKIQGWRPSPRGTSHVFGDDVLLETIARLDIDLVVRAHQVVQDGYEMNPTQHLVTVFSAPNYCNEFDNSGAVMYIDQTLSCSFIQFRPMTSSTSGHGTN